MSALEIVAVVTSFLAIWLTAKRRMLCWPINLLACALYFKLFLDVRLYADMMLQAVFGVGILYGWVVWSRGKDESGEVAVVPLRSLQRCAAMAAGAAGAVAIGWFTSRYTNAALPWMDSTLTSFSLVAQYWTARRHAANERYTFGTGKIGVLGGYTSAIVLGLVALYMAVESVIRLVHPQAIAFGEAIPIACLGLTVNIVSAILLGGAGHHHHGHDHHGHSH